MSIQDRRSVEEPKPAELWPDLWVGAALVAMVMFSYWLSMS